GPDRMAGRPVGRSVVGPPLSCCRPLDAVERGIEPKPERDLLVCAGEPGDHPDGMDTAQVDLEPRVRRSAAGPPAGGGVPIDRVACQLRPDGCRRRPSRRWDLAERRRLDPEIRQERPEGRLSSVELDPGRGETLLEPGGT